MDESVASTETYADTNFACAVVATIIELCEFNNKKKNKKKKNTMDKMLYIRPKRGSLMKYLVHRLLLTCSVL